MTSKIETIRESLNTTIAGGFIKPDPQRQETLVKNLGGSVVAQDYLHIQRGLTKETVAHFKLGYDIEKNAISIPVFKRGELINIRYRFIDKDSKQKYCSERGCEVWMYNEDGVNESLKKGAVMITEGEIDLMSCWQAGFKAVISPSSGKESCGMWIELLDKIPKIYVAFDNDKPGKSAALKLAERLGIDKCLEVCYKDVKDANEFFASHTRNDFIQLIREAKPYYKYKFKGVGDIIDGLKIFKENLLKMKLLPFVEAEEDWVIMVSAPSNHGKTAYVLNLANELASRSIPTLVLPYERGIRSVGKRYLQIRYNKTTKEFERFTEEDWNELILDSANLPLYFSMPNKTEFEDTIVRAKRIFDTRVVIIDHLDYFISGKDRTSEQADMIRKIKEIGQEQRVIFIVVHQMRKKTTDGSVSKRPTMDDMKGSVDISQVAEAVALLYKSDEGEIEVIIDKNKGEMGYQKLDFNTATGVMKIQNEDINKEFEEW